MVIGITRQWGWYALPLLGGAIGKFLDDKETQRMTLFRDKSALYGRELAPGQEPSW